MFTQRTEEVLDEDALAEETSPTEDTLAEETSPADEDEAIIEDVDEDSQEQTPAPPKMKSVVVDEWVHLNGQPPIWVR